MPKQFRNGHALLIGVGADLPSTVDDAEGLRSILTDPMRSAYPHSQVRTLCGNEATKQGITRGLEQLVRGTDSDSTAIIYFSGHGYQIKSARGSTSYIFPYGYNLQQLEQTAIDIGSLQMTLGDIQTNRLLILLDCCHSASLVDVMIENTAQMSLADEDMRSLSGKGRVVIASSQENEVSFTGKPYSVFTLALLEALSGIGASRQDGYVRVSDLAMHVREVVPRRTENRQHPVLYFERADDFVVAYYAGGDMERRGLPVTARPEPHVQADAGTSDQPYRSEANVTDNSVGLGGTVAATVTATAVAGDLAPQLGSRQDRKADAEEETGTSPPTGYDAQSEASELEAHDQPSRSEVDVPGGIEPLQEASATATTAPVGDNVVLSDRQSGRAGTEETRTSTAAELDHSQEETPPQEAESPDPSHVPDWLQEIALMERGTSDRSVEADRLSKSELATRLIAALSSPHSDIYEAAVQQLDGILSTEDADWRQAIAQAMSSADRRIADFLPDGLKSQPYGTRKAVVRILGVIGNPRENVSPLVIVLLEDGSKRVRRAAAEALQNLWRKGGFRPLVVGLVGTHRVLDAVYRIEKQELQAEVLVALAPDPLRMLEEAKAQETWDKVRGIPSASVSAIIRASLIRYLPKPMVENELLMEALAAVQRVKQDPSRAQGLRVLAPQLVEEPQLFAQALSTARSLKDESARAHALLGFVLHVSENLREEVVRDIQAAIGRMTDPVSRGQLSADLQEKLSINPDATNVRIANDLARGQDRLGFAHYADAFEQLTRDADPPVTVGVYGAWGTGKTFLMNMIAERLGYKPKERLSIWSQLLSPLARAIDGFSRWFVGEPARESTEHRKGTIEKTDAVGTQKSSQEAIVIWFEAWDYGGCDKLWAGLVESIFRALEDSELQWRDRLLINLPRNLEHYWRRFRSRWLPYTLIAMVVTALLVVLWVLDEQILAIAVGSSVSILSIIYQTLKIIFTPASKRVADLFTGPDYEDDLGFMARIRDDLKGFVQSLPPKMKVVVFIDDLDRCDPKKAVEVLEAIKLLLELDRFFVFIALDARIITRAIEDHYGAILTTAQITGYEYLDKIVQIPFSVPEPPLKELRQYLGWLVNMRPEEIPPVSEERVAQESSEQATMETPADIPSSQQKPLEDETEVIEVHPPVQSEQARTSATTLPEAASLGSEESVSLTLPFVRGEQEALLDLYDYIDPNPRRIKRLVNIYRLVRALIMSECKDETNGTTVPKLLRNPRRILAWLVLCEQWPYAAHLMLETLECNQKKEDFDFQNAAVDELCRKIAQVIDERGIEEFKRLDLDYVRLRTFVDEYVKPLRLAIDDIMELRPYTVNFNPALSSEVRLTLRHIQSAQEKTPE